MTREVILALGLLLGAALVARFVASLLRVPEMLVLVVAGVALGGSALDVVDVPLDSRGGWVGKLGAPAARQTSAKRPG